MQTSLSFSSCTWNVFHSGWESSSGLIVRGMSALACSDPSGLTEPQRWALLQPLITQLFKLHVVTTCGSMRTTDAFEQSKVAFHSDIPHPSPKLSAAHQDLFKACIIKSMQYWKYIVTLPTKSAPRVSLQRAAVSSKPHASAETLMTSWGSRVQRSKSRDSLCRVPALGDCSGFPPTPTEAQNLLLGRENPQKNKAYSSGASITQIP